MIKRNLSNTLVVAFAIAAWCGSLGASAAAAQEPIEGVWVFQGDVDSPITLRVEPSGAGTFQGIVLTPDCGHPVGQVIWRLNGSGDYYTGTHEWQTDCVPDRPGNTAWRLMDGGNRLFYCTVSPDNPAQPQISPDGTFSPSEALCYSYLRQSADSPDTRIERVSTPGNAIRVRFSSDDASASFLCKLDSRRWRPCASPNVYGRVSDGRHVVRVRAVDAAGNQDPSPARATVRI